MEVAELNPGDCMMSISPKLDPPVADFDLVTFTWPQPLDDGQIIIRGKDYQEEKSLPKKPIDHLLTANEDRLLYTAAQALWVEDEEGKLYYEKTDFVFEGRLIRWLNPPADGTRVSVKYQCFFDWISYASPSERRDKGDSLGPQVALRKVHVVFTTEDPHQQEGLTGDTRLNLGTPSTLV